MRKLVVSGFGVLLLELYLRGNIVRVNLGHPSSKRKVEKEKDGKKLKDISQHFVK